MIIVSASDRNFVPGLLVLIYSAWLNNRQARLHVIDAGLEAYGRQAVADLCERHGMDCRIIAADPDQLARLPSAGHLSSASYARLFIPDLLPGHDRAIYIDSDALVIADLEPLWRFGLDDDLLAGVVDPGMLPESLERFAVPQGQYVNSGVMLINLERWRTEQIGARCVDQLRRHPDFELADQTAINIVAKGRIRHLDPRFNHFAANRMRGDAQDLRILHFTGADKPWETAGMPLGEIFRAYLRASGARFPEPRREWDLRSLRKTAFGLLALRPKYWRPLLWQAERRSFVRRHVRALSTKAAKAAKAESSDLA